MAACGNYDVLAVVGAGAVRHRRSLAPGRQAVFPELTARFEVECPEIAVHGGADENEVAGCGDGTAHMGGAEIPCWCEPRADAFGRSEGYLPDNPIPAKVDADEGAPWRSSAGQSPRRQQRFPPHRVGCAGLAREVRMRVIVRLRLLLH